MIVPVAELPFLLAPGARLAGLDVGSKTLGVAVSDPFRRLATPVATIRRVKLTADLKQLAEMLRDRAIGGYVIGLPLNMDGTEGPRCQSVRAFARSVSEAFGDPAIALWDERLSTAAVTRQGVETLDLSRRQRAAGVDAQAAVWILQGALDAMESVRVSG